DAGHGILDRDWAKGQVEKQKAAGTDIESRKARDVQAIDAARKLQRKDGGDDEARKLLGTAKQRLQEYDKEHPNGGADRKMFQGDVDFYSKLLHKSSFRGSNDGGGPDYRGLLHNTAFVTNGRSGLMGGMSGFEGVIASGTKIGFLAAFRELMVDQSVGADGAGAGGNNASGFTKASYESGNSATAAGRSIGRAERGGDLLGPNEPTGAAHLRVSKGMASNAKETYEFWRKQGFSRNAALGFVGNEQGEGTLARGAATGRGRWGLHWDGSHNSGGAVQWDPARRADIMKHTGIDVWGKSTSHADQLLAEEWEIKHRYPKLWEQLRRDKISIGQATHGLVHTYERPADPGGQSRLRGSYGEGWAKRLEDGPPRKATGLTDGHDSAGKAPAGVGGHLQVDINDRSSTHNVTIQSRGDMRTNLRRWPKLDSAGLNV
ncbi:MAG: phage tail tip lysozyme, partial [Candidatus Aquicultor sp.]